MEKLFAQNWVRKFLAAALMLIGMRLVGRSTGLWMDLTGAGLAVAGWIIWRVPDNVDDLRIFRETILLAGSISAMIVVTNFNGGLLVVVGLLWICAMSIAIMAQRALSYAQSDEDK